MSSETKSNGQTPKTRPARRKPNILITGTPGTGKTTLAAAVAKVTGLSHLCVGDIIRKQGFHGGKISSYNTFSFDDDNVDDLLDFMEDSMDGPEGKGGGNVVDYHGCDFFPERWFDLVLVLRVDNGQLYDRLEKRSYGAEKIRENISAELLRVCLDEAKKSYDSSIVHAVDNNNMQDFESNVERCAEWVQNWYKERDSQQ